MNGADPLLKYGEIYIILRPKAEDGRFAQIVRSTKIEMEQSHKASRIGVATLILKGCNLVVVCK